MCLDIWPRGYVGAQSCSDPRPANTHVIKTDMVAPIGDPPRPLARPRHNENASRYRCTDRGTPGQGINDLLLGSILLISVAH